MNNINNTNKLFDDNLPIIFSDFMNDNIIQIHKELYEDALKKFEKDRKKENNDFTLDDYKIIEIKNEANFLKPSSILLIHNHNFKKEKIDLSSYWNTNYVNDSDSYLFNELLIDKDNKKNIEVEEIDYIHGKIKFRNKFNNKTFTIDKSKIDFNATLKNKLENTFGFLVGESNQLSSDKPLKSKVEQLTLDGIYKIK